QIGNLLDLEALGTRDLKGFADPVPVWMVRGSGRRVSRFEALRGNRLVELRGRDEAVQSLSKLWSMAKTGAGGLATISGEAGIGKSRLVHELSRTARSDGGTTQAFY